MMDFSRALPGISALVFVMGLLLFAAPAGYAVTGNAELFFSSFGWPVNPGLMTGINLMGLALFGGCLGEIGTCLFDIHEHLGHDCEEEGA
jgi:hypothetical protein